MLEWKVKGMTVELLAAMDMSRSHTDEYLAVIVGLKKNMIATYQGLGYN
ncbi:hypothetical protein CENSYa_1294 [Cenarchaeum symbiosum A]|uniref:Uncharacterized protein n=1 Tax=Cenarchaeum symbiosum (strain A) TaxID=414004 RepID=A0RX50_CENSY|nr:hypothetical protein CENSYa_1294 [Cenarchaeum symbiosum A]